MKLSWCRFTDQDIRHPVSAQKTGLGKLGVITSAHIGFWGHVVCGMIAALPQRMPSAMSHLAVYADDTGPQTDYIVVELVKRLLGDGWQQGFVERVRDGGVERVLL